MYFQLVWYVMLCTMYIVRHAFSAENACRSWFGMSRHVFSAENVCRSCRSIERRAFSAENTRRSVQRNTISISCAYGFIQRRAISADFGCRYGKKCLFNRKCMRHAFSAGVP